MGRPEPASFILGDFTRPSVRSLAAHRLQQLSGECLNVMVYRIRGPHGAKAGMVKEESDETRTKRRGGGRKQPPGVLEPFVMERASREPEAGRRQSGDLLGVRFLQPQFLTRSYRIRKKTGPQRVVRQQAGQSPLHGS